MVNTIYFQPIGNLKFIQMSYSDFYTIDIRIESVYIKISAGMSG